VIFDNQLLDALAFIAVLAPAIILHEVMHGAIAYRLGDPTAHEAGRLTLNPIKHVDPFGSVLLPAMLALARQNVFGWAKPVPVNPNHFAHPTRGMAITALGGPATNLTLAFLVGRLGPFSQVDQVVFVTSDSVIARFLLGALVVNAALAVFNMLPIPPLDGSRLLPLILTDNGRRLYARASQYGFFVLFALLFIFDDSLNFLGSWIAWILRLVV
jgi:Zn-dependent protease